MFEHMTDNFLRWPAPPGTATRTTHQGGDGRWTIPQFSSFGYVWREQFSNTVLESRIFVRRPKLHLGLCCSLYRSWRRSRLSEEEKARDERVVERIQSAPRQSRDGLDFGNGWFFTCRPIQDYTV